MDARRSQLLLRSVVLPTAAALFALAVIVGGVLLVATGGSDLSAVRRQSHMAQLALNQSIAAVRRNQEASTYWDDAVRQVHKRPLDLPWIDRNLGVWFHSFYGIDEAYLLDPHLRAVYAMRAGQRRASSSFAGVAAPVVPLAVALRAKLLRGDTVRAGSQEQTLGVADVAVIHGHPAIVSVKPILSETGAIHQARGSEFLHVNVRYLDGSLLRELAAVYGVDAPAVVQAPDTPAQLPVRNARGAVIGYLTWQPFLPGLAVARRVLPILLIVLLAIGAGLAWLLHRNLRARVELETSRAQAQHLAFHDVLTGLPNRALFTDRLDHALAAARRGQPTTLLLLDLDRFKHVNDTYGHHAGDALIREFGGRVCALVREQDTVARLGGDEFAILLSNGMSTAAVDELCERILGAVREPFEILGNRAFVGVSIGVVQAPEAGTDRTELIRKADIALYRAKSEGRDCYRHFDGSMDATVKLRGSIEDDLRVALATETGLALYYQPLVDSAGEIVGVEALMRWTHPHHGELSPVQVIPIAEETGLILPLGEWVLREACRAAERWPDLFVAVNVSPVQFRTAGFAERVLEIVRETGADPSQLELEVTESVLIDAHEDVHAALATLRSAGIRIALDDFGTGYSSLSYLRKFGVDKIKIDRSFIQHLGNQADSAAIIHAVVTLGHAMGLTVTAEGVETGDQQRFLRMAGCNQLQGYLFSRPVPAEQVAALLERPEITRVA